MRVIFWTLVDDVLSEYIELNKPLQDISKKYELYAMCSGEKSIDLIKKNYVANIIETVNDVRLKGKALFEVLKKRDDYDVLIKIDLDALVLDVNKLLLEIESHILPMTIMGNLRRSFTGRMYIRGGCHAVHRTVIDKIQMKIPVEKTGFDNPYNIAVLETGACQIDHHLFEICDNPTGNFPVWHPPKIKEGIEGIPLRAKVVRRVMADLNNRNLKKTIHNLNPWFYKMELNGIDVIPGIYNENKGNRGPEQLIYRQQCRKILLVDEIVKRYDFNGKTVLDVACNCGFWSSMYIENGAKSVVGIEGRENFIRQADLLYTCRGIREKAEFILGNVVEFDYSVYNENKFDFILCSGILYHIKDQTDLLMKLSMVNNEVMVIDTRVAESHESVFEKRELYFNAIESTRDKTIPTKKMICETMKELGYAVELIPPPFKIGIGIDTVDNYHTGRRICLFCKK